MPAEVLCEVVLAGGGDDRSVGVDTVANDYLIQLIFNPAYNKGKLQLLPGAFFFFLFSFTVPSIGTKIQL